MKKILGILFLILGASGLLFTHLYKKMLREEISPSLPQKEVPAAETPPLFILPIPTSSTISLGFSTATPRYISEWVTSTTDIALNGGYFHEDYTPSGYLVINGNRIGSRHFDENLTGLIVFSSNTIRIHDLSLTPLKKIPLGGNNSAIQSYPFLIKNGNPAVKEDSGKIARRTAIGLTNTHEPYLIVSRELMSLYELSLRLASSTPAFETVLNLDGGPSTGFIYRTPTTTEILDSITKIPQTILIDAW